MNGLKTNPIVVFLGITIVVMAALATVKGFATDTAPWLITVIRDLNLSAVDWAQATIGLLAGALAAAMFQLVRTYVGLMHITRDYYAEVSQLKHELDPEHHGAVSARVGSGDPDPQWANAVYRRYGLPALEHVPKRSPHEPPHEK